MILFGQSAKGCIQSRIYAILDKDAELKTHQNNVYEAMEAIRLDACHANFCPGKEFYQDEYIGKCDGCLAASPDASARLIYNAMVRDYNALNEERNLLHRRLNRYRCAMAIFEAAPLKLVA